MLWSSVEGCGVLLMFLSVSDCFLVLAEGFCVS